MNRLSLRPKFSPVLLLALALAARVVAADAIAYPSAPTGSVTDDYHGTKVADPYRWLEDVDAADTKAWVQAQNTVTFDFLAKLPKRELIKQRMMQLLNYPRYSMPSKQGGRYFYTHNTGLQNQSPLYVKDSLAAEGRVLIDPNTLSTDGTVALAGTAVSDDGKLIAYSTATAGSDWNEIRVRNVDTGADLADHLVWVKFSNTAWTMDGQGFFYSRYPAPVPGANATFSALAGQKLYYHRLGTPQSDDVLIFEQPDAPKRGWAGTITDDGRYLLIYGSEGTDRRNRLYYVDLQDPLKPLVSGPIVKLIDVLEADYTVIGNEGSKLFLMTDLDAAKSRIIAIDLAAPAKQNWRTLVPEAADVLRSAGVVGGKIIASYLQDAKSRVRLFGPDGSSQGDLPLPGVGIVSFTGRHDEPELFYSFTSFVQPTTIYRHDLATGQGAVFQAPKVDFDPNIYETRQVFYASKDGTKVPMFITARKGLKPDGSHPTLLHGYGGFNVSQLPAFSTSIVTWLELGGIYAVPNLRGGGEYGREWHLAGTKERKQNVFDDFIAAGDYLVREGYTSHDKLTLSGGSNGGLLVAAVINQRPDLARVALPAVGVMDMLRFHKFTIGHAWASDFGSAEDAAGFKYLSAYSPVHNVKAGAKYPAVLITTGDHDDRVHPGHSFKYAAAMQAANPQAERPTLIRIETKGGHGAGKPLAMQVEETADKFAFALHFTATGAKN
jgi:prolyl oligopeptidase